MSAIGTIVSGGVEKREADFIRPLTEKETLEYEQYLAQLGAINENSDIRNFANTHQDMLSDSLKQLLASCRVIDTGEAGSLINEVATATSGITRQTRVPAWVKRGLGFLHLQTGKTQRITRRLDTLTDSVEAGVAKLNNTLTLMHQVAVSVSERSEMLLPAIRALTDSAREDILIKETSPIASERLRADMRASEKLHRAEELALSYRVAQQQAFQCELIRNSNQQWIQELEHASAQALPIFQVYVLQELGLEAGRNAARTTKVLRTSVNKAIVATAKDISDNIGDLAQAHTETLISAESLDEAERHLASALSKIKSSRSKSLAETQQIVEGLLEAASLLDGAVESRGVILE